MSILGFPSQRFMGLPFHPTPVSVPPPVLAPQLLRQLAMASSSWPFVTRAGGEGGGKGKEEGRPPPILHYCRFRKQNCWLLDKVKVKTGSGTFLVVQWLRCHTPCAGGLGLIPGQGTRYHLLQRRSNILPTATENWCSQIKKRQTQWLKQTKKNGS